MVLPSSSLLMFLNKKRRKKPPFCFSPLKPLNNRKPINTKILSKRKMGLGLGLGLEGPKSLATLFFPRLVLLIAVIGAGAGASPASKFSSGGGGSIYDHLRQYGLPIGLLPKGITEYSLNTTSGEFRVFLAAPCHAKFENQVRYDFNVSGTLTFGRIADLSGVSAQELFLWFPVKGIRVDVPSSGLIYFDVGVVDKQFSLSLFESPPDCTALDPSDPSSSSSNSPSISASSNLNLNLKNESEDVGYKVGQRSELRAAS